MKLKKILLAFATFALLLSAVPQTASAQWSLGASYEIREAEPKNGFGVRLERGILQKLPIVDLALRGHFSYFSEENNLTRDNVEYGEIKNYDFGLAAIGGVSLGLLKPYVGLGLGSETTELSRADAPDGTSTSDSKLYWNGLVGSQVTIIPSLHPFVEYRFAPTEAPEKFRSAGFKSSSGRLIFGISLSF